MGIKLLLADDSITIQKVVGIIFSNEEYDLTVVGNGADALIKARETRPDIMLVDAVMPGRSCYEVCQEVRGDAQLSTTPLLLMTGAFEPFDEDKARQCGADDFISKPFESQSLVDKVVKLIEIGKQRAVSAPVAEPSVPSRTEELFAAVDADPWAEPASLPESAFEIAPEILEEPFAAADAADVFSEPAAIVEPITIQPSAFDVDIVEAAPGDDPWGVFDMIEL